MSYASTFQIAVSGTAVVCCVHDRQKRQIVTEEQIVKLGAEIGLMFQKGIHRVHKCACCENLFVADGMTERYCTVCEQKPIHALGGPLAEPKGVVA